MRLSAIVPTHDTREMTLGCLAALERAGVDEIVLVDDGSGDGTFEAVADRCPQARRLRHEQARGFSAAANAGLRAAGGELLWLVNSDALVPEGAGLRLREAFAARPRLGLAGSRLVNPDGSPQWSGGRRPGALWLFVLGSGLAEWRAARRGPRSGRPAGRVEWLSGAALALRREVFESCGPLFEGYRFYAQDLDLCWAALDAGWELALLDDPPVVHLGGATIGRSTGASGGVQRALLWSDLATCVTRRAGAAAGRRAALALRAGCSVRLAWRDLTGLALRGEARTEWLAESARLREARAAVAGSASG
jgi:GT2 family glycosyltransferase